MNITYIYFPAYCGADDCVEQLGLKYLIGWASACKNGKETQFIYWNEVVLSSLSQTKQVNKLLADLSSEVKFKSEPDLVIVTLLRQFLDIDRGRFNHLQILRWLEFDDSGQLVIAIYIILDQNVLREEIVKHYRYQRVLPTGWIWEIQLKLLFIGHRWVVQLPVVA